MLAIMTNTFLSCISYQTLSSWLFDITAHILSSLFHEQSNNALETWRGLQCLNLYKKSMSAWHCASGFFWVFFLIMKNIKYSMKMCPSWTHLADKKYLYMSNFSFSMTLFCSSDTLMNCWPNIRSRLIMQLCMWNVRDGSLSLWNVLTEPNTGRQILHHIFPVFCSHNSCHGKRTKAWMDPSITALLEGELGSYSLINH